MSRVRIIVMAKAPAPGLAKTRLIPRLGPERAAQLARRMLLHTLREALAADIGPVELCATPAPVDALWAAIAVPKGISWSAQAQGDLGARLARASAPHLAAGERVLLVGTDCPALDANAYRDAALALDCADAVLLPTVDGGYALLGLKRLHASLFENMPWSTKDIARLTLGRIRQLQWQVGVGPIFHDIDEPADLRCLPPSWGEFADPACKNSAARTDCTE